MGLKLSNTIKKQEENYRLSTEHDYNTIRTGAGLGRGFGGLIGFGAGIPLSSAVNTGNDTVDALLGLGTWVATTVGGYLTGKRIGNALDGVQTPETMGYRTESTYDLDGETLEPNELANRVSDIMDGDEDYAWTPLTVLAEDLKMDEHELKETVDSLGFWKSGYRKFNGQPIYTTPERWKENESKTKKLWYGLGFPDAELP